MLWHSMYSWRVSFFYDYRIKEREYFYFYFLTKHKIIVLFTKIIQTLIVMIKYLSENSFNSNQQQLDQIKLQVEHQQIKLSQSKQNCKPSQTISINKSFTHLTSQSVTNFFSSKPKTIIMSLQRSQKPISPQQMFQRLTMQSYRQSQCSDQAEKLKKQRQILFQLIVQYQKSIQTQLIKINQHEDIQRLRLIKIEQLERLRRQRQIIEQQVQAQFNRLILKKEEQNQKVTLVSELQTIRHTNSRLKNKLKDLADYVQKLEMHNVRLQDQKNIVQEKMATRMRVNSQDWREDWRQNVDMLRKKQEITQNQLKAKIMHKQSQNINHVRQQQEQISQRNQLRWRQFKNTAYKMSVIPLSVPQLHSPSVPLIPNYTSSRYSSHSFDRFRVI